jgi:excisionase family DNA binding protein
MYQRHTADTVEVKARPAHTPPLLLSVPQAARLLGVGTTLCWELVHGGQLPSVRLGRRVLVPRVAVEQLAQTGEAPTAHRP